MTIKIIKYGGSIVNPDGNFNSNSLTQLINLIKEFSEDKFIFIIGGGKMSRILQNNIDKTISSSIIKDYENHARDWLGISASRINAEIVRNKVSKVIKGVHSELLLNPEISSLPDNSRIFFSGGWKPGWSTDFVSLKFAEFLNVNEVYKVSDFVQVLDVSPEEIDKNNLDKYSALPKISWDKMIEIVGTSWIPGRNAPLDPEAAKLGKKMSFNGFKLLIGQMPELIKMIKKQDFIGTIVE